MIVEERSHRLCVIVLPGQHYSGRTDFRQDVQGRGSFLAQRFRLSQAHRYEDQFVVHFVETLSRAIEAASEQHRIVKGEASGCVRGDKFSGTKADDPVRLYASITP